MLQFIRLSKLFSYVLDVKSVRWAGRWTFFTDFSAKLVQWDVLEADDFWSDPFWHAVPKFLKIDYQSFTQLDSRQSFIAIRDKMVCITWIPFNKAQGRHICCRRFGRVHSLAIRRIPIPDRFQVCGLLNMWASGIWRVKRVEYDSDTRQIVILQSPRFQLNCGFVKQNITCDQSFLLVLVKYLNFLRTFNWTVQK